MNQLAKYLGQMLFGSKVIVWTHTHARARTHTHTPTHTQTHTHWTDYFTSATKVAGN